MSIKTSFNTGFFYACLLDQYIWPKSNAILFFWIEKIIKFLNLWRQFTKKKIQTRANVSKCMKRPTKLLKLAIERIHFESADCVLTVFLIQANTIWVYIVNVRSVKNGTNTHTFLHRLLIHSRTNNFLKNLRFCQNPKHWVLILVDQSLMYSSMQ